MKIRTGFGFLLSLTIAVSAAHAATPAAPAARGAAPKTAAKGAPASRAARLDAVTFLVRHRVFHQFYDQRRVKLNQDFLLGDTEFSARVVQFVPDFQMDL